MAELVVLLGGETAGVLTQNRSGDLQFEYDPGWRAQAYAYPLSLSIPLEVTTHPDSSVRPYLEGLLPNDLRVLERWEREHHVSRGNPFALLARMGEDCAGAVQFVRPERLDDVRGDDGAVRWLTETQVAEELRGLVRTGVVERSLDNAGYFSLAGAQPKTALLYRDGVWGIPSGRMATNHILKPPAMVDLDGFAVNEHFCLCLATDLGLGAAASRVMSFEDQVALVVERYDRQWEQGRVLRLHQEDFCQALSANPWKKYENEGGPGAVESIDLLLRYSSEPEADVAAFIDTLAFNWAIGGTDAHAKNYSLLLLAGQRVRLAPLYDLVSILPYGRWAYRDLKLAMRIGKEYRLWMINRRRWEDLAERCELDPGPVLERVASLLEPIPEAIRRTAERVREEGIEHTIIERLETALSDHVLDCRDRLR